MEKFIFLFQIASDMEYPEEHPEYEEEEEDIGEPDIDQTYLALLWAYLNHMLIPGNTSENFHPSFSPFPDDATYRRLMEMIRHTIDPYLSISDADDQTIINMANHVAQGVHRDLNALGFPEEIDPISYIYFQSVPYSNLPVILLYELGLVPGMFDDPEASLPPSLYPNEWKALLDVGISLCGQVGRHSYLYWLIENSWKGSSMYQIGGDQPENVLPHLPGYTADDIINNIRSDPECLRNDLNMREILHGFNRRRNEIIRDTDLTERMEENYEREVAGGVNPSDIERFRLQIERRRSMLDRQIFLLNQIRDASVDLGEIRNGIMKTRII